MPYALCPMPSRTSYESSKGYIFVHHTINVQRQQIIEQCKDTHAEAKDWLAKTNPKLSNS
jgi:hypothetical protein